MKKKLVAGMIVLCLAGMLSGCGGSNTVYDDAASSSAAQEEKSDKRINAGMYKIGKDIPAGEYILYAEKGDMAYWQDTSDSTGSFDSILGNGNFKNRAIVNIPDGTYFTLKRAVMYPTADAPKVAFKDNIVPEGTYHIGIDFPAGEYTVTADQNQMGYIEVSTDSNPLKMHAIVTNDNFEGQRYITVEEGQYLRMDRCTLHL